MNENLNEALERMGDKYLEEAAHYYKKSRRSRWLGAIAAVLAVALASGAVLHHIHKDPTIFLPRGLVAAPVYPQLAPWPNWENYEDSSEYSDAFDAWRESYNAQHDQPEGYANSLTDFLAKSIPEFLSGEGNQAYSPLNVYMALAMLAETAGGDSRQQILDLLGADSIESLRAQAGHVWNAHYQADGESVSILANALWLDEERRYKENTVQTLANSYYSSVYNGDLGSDEMNDHLRQWLDSQTGGLLKEYTQELELDPDTVFALTSTVYFNAHWYEPYFSETCTEGVFHSSTGDVTVSFMDDRCTPRTYYWGEDFGAVQLTLKGFNSMWLILPDEGKTVSDVLASEEYLQMTLNPTQWANQKNITVYMTVPKFDISSNTDMIEGMKNLGITEVFDPQAADLSNLAGGDTYVGKMEHAVRVTMDDQGVTAVAYTEIESSITGLPPEDEIAFVLDRPFLFMVTSPDDLPLFAGVVEQPG